MPHIIHLAIVTTKWFKWTVLWTWKHSNGFEMIFKNNTDMDRMKKEVEERDNVSWCCATLTWKYIQKISLWEKYVEMWLYFYESLPCVSIIASWSFMHSVWWQYRETDLLRQSTQVRAKVNAEVMMNDFYVILFFPFLAQSPALLFNLEIDQALNVRSIVNSPCMPEEQVWLLGKPVGGGGGGWEWCVCLLSTLYCKWNDSQLQSVGQTVATGKNGASSMRV